MTLQLNPPKLKALVAEDNTITQKIQEYILSGSSECRITDNGLMDGVKVIMITALKDKTNIFQAFHRGGESYIIKPFTAEKFKRELGNLHLLTEWNS